MATLFFWVLMLTLLGISLMLLGLMTITLNLIRSHSPCKDGWDKLLGSLGKTKADDEPLAFSRILESNGLGDALWYLLSISPMHDREIRVLACDYAERVLHVYEEKYPDDIHPRVAIETSRRYAEGKAKKKELDAAARACDAAWAADAERKAQEELLVKYFG